MALGRVKTDLKKLHPFVTTLNSKSNVVSITSMADKPKDSLSENDVKAPNILERAKEEFDAVFNHDKTPRHHKETHGRNNDIDEGTSIDEVKAPCVFERVKEEIEAVVEVIHPNKVSDTNDPPTK